MTHPWIKTVLFLLLDLLMAGRFLQAATVSVLIVEGGVGEGIPRVEASSAWEGGFMDALFDAGHIVCNADMVRQETSVLPPPGFGWAEAKAGGADFLAVVLLRYIPVPHSVRLVPFAVSWRLLDKSGSVVGTVLDQRVATTNSVTEDAKNGKDLAKVILVSMRDTR
jgi:hypothetical protein